MSQSATFVVQFVRKNAVLRGPQAWIDCELGYEFQSGGVDDEFKDVVVHDDNFWYCQTTHVKTQGNYPRVSADANNPWRLGDRFDMVATRILLSEYAVIDNLGVRSIETPADAKLKLSTEDNEIILHDDQGRASIRLTAVNGEDGDYPCNHPTGQAVAGGVVVGSSARKWAFAPDQLYSDISLSEQGFILNACRGAGMTCRDLPNTFINTMNSASLISLTSQSATDNYIGQTILTSCDVLGSTVGKDKVLGQYVEGGIYIPPAEYHCSNNFNNVMAGLVATVEVNKEGALEKSWYHPASGITSISSSYDSAHKYKLTLVGATTRYNVIVAPRHSSYCTYKIAYYGLNSPQIMFDCDGTEVKPEYGFTVYIFDNIN